MSITIGTLIKSVSALAVKIEQDYPNAVVTTDSFSSGKGGHWRNSYVELSVTIEVDGEGDEIYFEYNANGYGTPETYTGSAEFGQNQKWSEMKATTLDMVAKLQERIAA